MHAQRPRLANFAYDAFSQFGEDGILAKLFEIIGTQSKLSIEFGAWEGFFDSNTANLWTKDWHGVLIEGDATRFHRLQSKVAKYPCTCIQAYVEPSGPHSLERLLLDAGIQERPDFLSIDIDGNDYDILATLETLKPRVICIEYNPTLPPDQEIIPVQNNHMGCSIKSLTTLAEKKGYVLVATTDTNAIFLDQAEYTKLEAFETSYAAIVTTKHLTYLVTDYDGNYALVGKPPYGIKRPLQPKLRAGQLNIWPLNEPLWKRFAKRLRRSSIAESLLARTHYWVWKLNGKKTPPPHLYKQEVVRAYATKQGIRTLVETGTYLGQMLEAMAPHFTRLLSIEVEPNLYRRALKKFVRYPNVELLFGDSGQVLREVLPTLNEPALFWLDGHYSAGISGKGELETPVNAELEAILTSPLHHVVLIDDARCFDGTHDYPTLEDLKTTIASRFPNYELNVADDIIQLEPRAK